MEYTKIINAQQEIIKLQEEIITERKEKVDKILKDFNNLPIGEQLYKQQLNEKVETHKYRVKKYNQFIHKHGMEAFTSLLIKAHYNSDYLQNFYEFLELDGVVDDHVKDKIRVEVRKREFEMMKGIYMDFMPLLKPETVVTHMVYLDEDFGNALNELDLLC